MSNAAGAPKNARREAAREAARVAREQERKRRTRNRLLLQGGVGLVVLAIAAVVVFVITTSANTSAAPGPKNMISDGILLSGDGSTTSAVRTPALEAGASPTDTDQSKYDSTVNVVIYLDYHCPFCKLFEATNGEQLQSWLTDGVATLEVHPIAFLDNASLGAKYSTRAANAAACVAQYDPDKFLDFNAAMLDNQPAEQTTGPDDAAIKAVLAGAGITSPEIASCIDDGSFLSWTKAATDRVLDARPVDKGGKGPVLPNSSNSNFEYTPFVTIDGVPFTGTPDDAAAFLAAMDAAAEAKGIAAGATPAPSN